MAASVAGWARLLCLLAAVPTIKGASDSGLNRADSHSSPEHRLFNDLFIKSAYNKHIRPVMLTSDITHVFFELSLFNILHVDTKRQKITTNSEIIMKWLDIFLKWDPRKYNGTHTIRVPYSDIWFPDIIMENTAEAGYESSLLNTNVIIKYTGEVELASHGVLTSVCIMDVQWYPFDQQTCKMVFAPWTYDNKRIILLKGPADLSEYSENPEFYLEDFYSELKDVNNPCCLNPMSTMIYYLQIQRRTIFSLFFFIMPGILINMCALMVFSLPSETGEKVGLGINSMLAMMVFLMAMTENLPPTQKLPLAGVYYGTCITMITMNIIFSVTVLNLNVMGMRGYHVPEFIKLITLFMAKIIVVRVPIVVRESWDLDENGVMITPVEKMDDTIDLDGTLVRVFTVQPPKPQTPQKESKAEVKSYKDEVFDPSQLKDPFQRHALAALESMKNIMMRDEEEKEKATKKSKLVEQWKFVSRVMDRTLFITFTSITVTFNLIILTSSPFRELFSYCPAGEGMCEGLTMDEIVEMTSDVAHHTTLPGVTGEVPGGGGHGAPAAAHLTNGHDPLVGIRVGPAYEGYEGLGLLPDYGPGPAYEGLGFLREDDHEPVTIIHDPPREGGESPEPANGLGRPPEQATDPPPNIVALNDTSGGLDTNATSGDGGRGMADSGRGGADGEAEWARSARRSGGTL